jgi:CRISPR-associated endonuclease/helicase Cas3
MHQLCNAVIIFDEVQTIPIRCVQMFNVAVRFLVKSCGSTVVLCTATQPLLDKIEIKERALEISQEQQIVQDVQGLFKDLKRVQVHDYRKIGGWEGSEIADLAKAELSSSGSVLIIVNTKLSAKNLYQQLQESGSEQVFHLSTDMCPAHRMEILDDIKDRLGKKPTICVSTQLIEAGVDIDFGSVIRFLAGLDSIAQASGRCNRHGLRKRGNVFVVNSMEEHLNRLKDIKIGAEKAERVLEEYKENPGQFDQDILSPAAIDQFYRYYFYERRNEMNYPVNSKSQVGRDDNLFDLLSTNSQSVQEYQRIHQSSPPIVLRQAFQSAARAFRAIESPTRGVVVPYGGEGRQIVVDLCAAFEVEREYRLLKRAQRFSVNVYPHVFDELAKRKAIHEVQEGAGIFYLASEYYSDKFGLSREIVNEMPTYTV